MGRKQLLAVVVDEMNVEWEFVEPGRRVPCSIKMNLFRLVGEVVGEALEFKCGAATDDEPFAENCLKRDDSLLPIERTTRALVDLPRWVFEPPGFHVLPPQRSRIALLGKPGSIHQ